MKNNYVSFFLLLFSTLSFAQSNPSPFNLSNGNFVFNAWDSLAPAGTYPANMIFHGAATNDIDSLGVMAGDYANNYNLPNRTRIKGLGVDGVMFVNTGNADTANGQLLWLGAAMVSLNSSGRGNLTIGFTGGTISEQPRVYGFILQYRVGTTDPWTTVQQNGNAVVYVAGTTGSQQVFSGIVLPPICNNKPVVQVRWMYHQHLAGSGARSWLRLDDISISSSISTDVQTIENNFKIELFPNPTNDFFQIKVNEEISLVQIYDLNGKLITTENPQSSNFQLNTNGFAKGLYMVVVTTESGKIAREKVLVQ